MHTIKTSTQIIDTIAHPLIQHVQRLAHAEERQRTGMFYIEGLRFVAQAVQHDASFEALIVCRALLDHAFGEHLIRQQRRRGTPVREVSARVFHHMTRAEDPQGIGAIVKQRWEDLSQVTPNEELCWLVLHAVHSPGNLGTIVRTMDAVGGAGLILLSDRTDPFHPSTVRATMGALFAQRLISTSVKQFRQWKQHHQLLLIGTSPSAPQDYQTISYRSPTLLLMGEERKGLPADLQALCDEMVNIPMVGESDSLNLGIATGIMLYELFNQRRRHVS